jgi:hypothetical protein
MGFTTSAHNSRILFVTITNPILVVTNPIRGVTNPIRGVTNPIREGHESYS